jgi:ribose transport system ATP-binding protein
MLEMNNIYKTFGGVNALSDVSIKVEKGEVHALIGENGAGKSTLMKILAGAIKKDSGSIIIDGKEVNYNSPKKALDEGISIIYQELNLVPDLSVAENIFLDGFLTKSCFLDRKQMYKIAGEVLKELGTDISPRTKIGQLTVARQQMVEIAKAIKNKSRIVVFDEPSAVLGIKDSEILFEEIAKLKKQGISVIYISHRLTEVLRITDKITILRDGKVITTKPTKDLKMESIVAHMTGKDYNEIYNVKEYVPNNKEIVFEVKNICSKDLIKNVSFYIRKGEVLGLAGLVGSGRSEIARAIFGADKKSGGEIFIHGKRIKINTPKQAKKHGIGFVLEDRKTSGLLINQPIFQNVTITGLKKYKRAGLINKKSELASVVNFKEKLQIKTNNIKNPVSSLSGGNQQKVSIAKWMHIEPEVLILDEPTRGVDVGAKSEIYKLIDLIKNQDKAILLISSEFSEILGLSDRIMIVKRGEIAGEFTRKEIQENSSILEEL